MKKSTAIVIISIVFLLFAVFFIYPVIEVLKVAFLKESGEMTLEYFLGILKDPIYLEGLWNALQVGVVSTIVTFAISFPLALASNFWNFPFKKVLTILVLAPLVLPPFVGAVGVKHIFGVEGAFNSLLIDFGLMSSSSPYDWLGEGRFWAVVMMLALHLYPILYMNIVSALRNLDPAMEQAAQNLGASPWSRLRKITLPLCMPGVFAGASIVFIWSFTELGVPLVFDYSRVAPVQIFDGLKSLESDPTPYAIVAVMLVISVTVFVVSKLILGRSKIGTSSRPKGQREIKNLSPFAGWIVSAGFMILFLVASIPHLGVLFLSVSKDWYGTVFPESLTGAHYADGLSHPMVIDSIKNSLLYASGATLIDIVLGCVIAYVIVRSTVWGRNLLDALMILPLAVPGLVLAFGYFALSQENEPFHFLVEPLGSPALLLVIAYAIRRLPYVVRAIVSGLEQSDVTLEEAALSMGAPPRRAFHRIALPLIGANLIAGSILAFVFAVLEVSDSLILAQQMEHYPVTKAIYALLGTLGSGHEIASALGVWAMVFLGVAIVGAFFLVGKRGRNLFRL